MRGKIGALLAAIGAAMGAAIGAVGAATWAKRRKGEDELDLEVTESTVIPTAPKAPAKAVAAKPAPGQVSAEAAPGGVATTTEAAAPAAVDDLTAIKGLGKVKVAKLAAMGITSYAQVAAWTEEDIAEVGLKVNTSPGQIKREDWVGQAKALAEG